MGQAKIKQRSAFTPQLIEEWEASDCVNFAVGLVRLTGWLLHVDWWTTAINNGKDIPLNQLKPLRVYVADNGNRIFDVRGIRSVVDYNENILKRRFPSYPGGVLTRFYDEARLPSLPLRSQPDETMIVRAIEAIKANSNYLAAIPIRTSPCIPAYQAAHFTFGRCVPFAEAMRELTGLQPVALLAVRFSETHLNENGYFHSVVLHPDGMAEDAWGKATLKDIANRFGVIDFNVSRDDHHAAVKALQQNSSDLYEIALKDAIDLIKTYRGATYEYFSEAKGATIKSH